MTTAAAAREHRGDARLLADLALVGQITSCRPNARERLEQELGPERARALVDSLSRRTSPPGSPSATLSATRA